MFHVMQALLFKEKLDPGNGYSEKECDTLKQDKLDNKVVRVRKLYIQSEEEHQISCVEVQSNQDRSIYAKMQTEKLY